MKTYKMPFKISIAKPCPARWEDMGGSDQVRFCDHCCKNVYNLSSMTVAEATALLQEKKGNLCARIYQRADGTVLTEDCPVGVAQYWRRIKIFTASAVTILALATVNLAAATRRNPAGGQGCSKFRVTLNEQIYKVKGWMGLNPPPVALMGAVAPVARIIPPPAAPLMGKIALVPHHKTNAPVMLTGRVSLNSQKLTNNVPLTNNPGWLMGDPVVMPANHPSGTPSQK